MSTQPKIERTDLLLCTNCYYGSPPQYLPSHFCMCCGKPLSNQKDTVSSVCYNCAVQESRCVKCSCPIN